MLFGWRGRRKALPGIDHRVKEDALWRSTSGEIWELAMSEVFGRMGELQPGAPPALEPGHQNTFDIGGAQDRDRNSSGRETGQMWPALGEMYTSYYQEHGRYRAGFRELAP